MSNNNMVASVLKAIHDLKGYNGHSMRCKADDIFQAISRKKTIMKMVGVGHGVTIRDVRSALKLLVRHGYVRRTGNLVNRIFTPEYDTTLASNELLGTVDKIVKLCSCLAYLNGGCYLPESDRQFIGHTIDEYLQTYIPIKFTLGYERENELQDEWAPQSSEDEAAEDETPSPARDFTAVLGTNHSKEEAAVLDTLCDAFETNFLEPCQLNAEACKSIGSLVQRGIIENVHLQNEHEQGSDLDARNSYRLTADTVGKLYAGREDLIRYEQISYYAEVLPWEKIPAKELFYNKEDAERIEKVRKLANPERMAKIREELEKNHLRKSSAILLHGGPGTGKTELVKQIARETKRTLFIADASKLTSNQYGGEEKNYKDLFDAFNYVAKLCLHQPILLFNEADGLMHKRLGSPERSLDILHNTVQTIILQGVENMDGLFIATTNMQASLDDAFESRFVDNICVHEPDAETRFKILSSKMRDINPDWLRIIAERYPLTGRLIDNLYINCVHIKCLSDKELDFEMLDNEARQLCEKKTVGLTKKIGFNQ